MICYRYPAKLVIQICVILLTISPGTNNILYKQEHIHQYEPYVIPSKLMPSTILQVRSIKLNP